jgi:hypothetical protein
MIAKHSDSPREDPTAGRPASTPWWAWGCSGELSRANIANARRYLILSAVWAVSLVLTLLALKAWGEALGPAAYVLALVPAAAFLGVIWAYIRFLRGADELTRKIHFEGMAVGFAAGLAWILCYPVLEAAGAPALELIDATYPMVFGYTVAVALAQRRYR